MLKIKPVPYLVLILPDAVARYFVVFRLTTEDFCFIMGNNNLVGHILPFAGRTLTFRPLIVGSSSFSGIWTLTFRPLIVGS